jgi:hypothetical protein
MSVARSYTDFHIDFGGSSVFYHILRGKKTFLFIEPTSTNLRRYEAWCGDSDQSRRFLGEEVKECTRVDLSAGDTMIIPSGWIHAVYTPSDSLVLGGNFLTPLHISSQLQIANIETRTRVPKKFRFPFFDMAMWYTAVYYLETYIPRRNRGPTPKAGRRHTEQMSDAEISGLQALAEWLWRKAKLRTQQIAKGAEYHRAKVEVPPGLDVMDVAGRFARWVYDGDEDEEVPVWFRSEVLLVKVETPKKRKREDEGPRRKSGRGLKRVMDDDEGLGNERKRVNVDSRPDTLSSVEIPLAFTCGMSRPVTSYLSRPSRLSTGYSNWTTPMPATTYPPTIPITTSQPLKLIKPYANTRSTTLEVPGPSFVDLIKPLRPYIRITSSLLDEIKVEDEPLGGLDALSRAVELATQPTYYAPSTGSTLTIYSSPDFSSRRLPTPPSQSPPAIYDSLVRGAALGLRERSSSMAEGELDSRPVSVAPGGNVTRGKRPRRGSPGKDEEAEAKRLRELFSTEEMVALRKQRRRGVGHLFSASSLRKELDKIGRSY